MLIKVLREMLIKCRLKRRSFDTSVYKILCYGFQVVQFHAILPYFRILALQSWNFFAVYRAKHIKSGDGWPKVILDFRGKISNPHVTKWRVNSYRILKNISIGYFPNRTTPIYERAVAKVKTESVPAMAVRHALVDNGRSARYHVTVKPDAEKKYALI